MNKLLFIQVLLLFLNFASAFAQQNPQPFARNYNTEHGLPSSEVYFAFEDSKGYMWFGTDNGASRFDGYNFKNYGPSEGLTSIVVFNIMEDTLGQIWFGTMTGEAFILKGDTIVPYQYNHLVQQYKDRFSGASLVFLDQNETAFFGLGHFGILSISSNGKIDSLKTDNPFAGLSFHQEGFVETAHVFTLYRENKDYDLWNKKSNEEAVSYLEIIQPNQQRIKINLPQGDRTVGSRDIQKLPNDDYLYISHGDLYCLRDSQILWKRPYLERIIEIIIEPNETIWLTNNDGGGLRRYKNLKALKNDQYDLFFNGLSVSNMCKITKGGYWITTTKKGVFYIPDFQTLTYGIASGLTTEYITSVGFKSKNEMFFGLHNNEVYSLSLADHQTKLLGTGNSNRHAPSLLYDTIRHILWAGGFYFEDENLNYTTFPATYGSDPLAYNSAALHNLHANSKRQLIGNTGFTGIQIIDMDHDTLIYTSTETDISDRYYALHCDQDDRIWVTNDEGLFEFRDSMLIRPTNMPEHPAFHSRIESMDKIRDSAFVLGTKGYGVVIWDGKDMFEITTENGLTSNMLEDIHVDEKENIWASTLNGLNKIYFDSDGGLRVRTYSVVNGLPSNEISQTRTFKDQIWVCTTKGLVNLKETTIDTISSTPRIQNIAVNNQPKNKDQTSSFKYNQNNFTFEYLTINYCQYGQIPYRYRINDNSNWQYTKNLSVNYPSLPKGNYNFEVQSQNQDGYWSESTSYSFTINSPWWETSWFRALCIFCFSLLGYSIYKFRTNQLKKENQRQLQLINMERQLTDLEKSALQAQMNPHFIFNALNSIQNFILKNDQQKAVEFLSRFAKLVRNNLNASVDGEILLEDEVNNLDNYLALEQERFNHRFTYEILLDKSIQDELIEFPPMLVQPYVENAVIHGLSKKGADGKIKINFNKIKDELIVTVRDNGVGYRQDQTGKQNERHKSVGMTITRKRLELLGANPENSVKILTLTNEITKEVIGTEVVININTSKSPC